MPYDAATDPGPDWDAEETAKAVAYVAHIERIVELNDQRKLALKGDDALVEELIHNKRPVMKSSPTYLEGAKPQ